MSTSTHKICQPLPADITKWISTCKNSKQYIINFLQNSLPQSDSRFVIDELRKTYIFDKCKLKNQKTNTKQKRKGKFLSARKRALLGLSKIGCKSDIKYTDLLPLNELWLTYMQNLLGNKPLAEIPRDPTDVNWENVNQQLSKADFHGAKISVIKSICPSLVGISGIVIQDTKNTFRICGEDNIIRTLPKNVTELKIYLKDIMLRVLGKQLSTRPAERTVKKIKSTRVYDL